MALVTAPISTSIWIAIEEKKACRETISWNIDTSELGDLKWFVKTARMVRVECKAEDWSLIASWTGMVAVETANVSLKTNLKNIGRTTNLKVVRLNKLKVGYDHY